MTAREVVLEGGSPWGFRIQGGADTKSPLRISRVNSSGKAVLKGIREGDIITSINGKSTKNLSYSEAHTLIKNSEDPLRLGLIVDTGSPRNRSRPTVHETHSETLKILPCIPSDPIEIPTDSKSGDKLDEKGTSRTLYSRNSTKTIYDEDNDYADPEKFPDKQASIERQNNSKEHIEPPLSPDSTVSSLSSSSTLTEAGIKEYVTTHRNSLGMADCISSKTRRKRAKTQRRRQRRSNNPQLKIENEETIEGNENTSKEDYEVDFPDTGDSKPKIKKKSKSLDDEDDSVKIQEVEGPCEEDRQHCEAIISEADSDWEEATDLRVPQNPVSLSTVAIAIDEEPFQRVGNFSPEEELSLRNFLEGINLVNSPGPQVSSTSTLDSIKHEKARKRDALIRYFKPLVQNPRFLDIISEEGSDLSDRESSTLTRHLKQGTPELENRNTSSSQHSPRAARRNQLRRLQLKKNEDKAVLVCTKIVETPSIIEHVHTCTSENVEPEKVYLESSSDNASSENSSESTPVELEEEENDEEDAGFNENGSSEEMDKNESETNEIEDDEKPPCTHSLEERVNEDPLKHPNNKSDYIELTPPPTPEHSPKKLSTHSNSDFDLNESMKGIVTDTAKEITAVLSKLETNCSSVSQTLESSSAHSPSLSGSSSRETSPSTVRLNLMTSSFADVASISADLELAREVSSYYQPSSLRKICLECLVASPYGFRLTQELSKLSINCEKISEAGKDKLESAASFNLTNTKDANNSNLISEVTEEIRKIMSSKKWAGLPFYNNPDLLLYLSNSEKSHLDDTGRMETPYHLQSQKSTKERKTEITSCKSYSMDTSRTLPKNFKQSDTNPRLHVSNLDEWLDIARENDETIKPGQPLKQLCPKVPKRRTSLPDEIYQRQLQTILQKEKEIEHELEALLEEKRKLYVEMRDYRDEDQEKPRPKSFPQSPSEVLRQKMYDEYMKQVAEREERKHHKMIKITSAPSNKDADLGKSQFEAVHLPGIEDEFMKKLQERHGTLEKVDEEIIEKEELSEEKSSSILLIDGKSVKKATDLPRHLREFVEITADTSEENSSDTGIWSPGQKKEFAQTAFGRQQQEKHDESIPSFWQPKSATSSPLTGRKEYRPVSFESPKLARKNQTKEVHTNSENSISNPHWQDSVQQQRVKAEQSSTLDRRIPTSRSAPATGFSEFTTARLPRAQNPTVVLLQKAREGQLPKGASYIEANKDHYRIPHEPSSQGEINQFRKTDHYSESDSEILRHSDQSRRKIEGVGPLNRDGMPLSLRSEVRDTNQSKWYKKMYDTIHKQKPYRDEFVTVRYKPRRAQYPYISGYLSEPEPTTYESNHMEHKYATLDRRRTPMNEKENFSTSTMPRNSQWKAPSNSDYALGLKTHPGRIENYIPGRSSISDQESKKWWDEMMDIFDGKMEDDRKTMTKGYMSQALKESGYESDSTLVFRKKDDGSQLSPLEQREAYKIIQRGGDVPLHGLRKPAPERPKENSFRPVSPTFTDSLTDLNVFPGQEIFCYPVTVHTKRDNVFSDQKKNTPTNVSAPSPPKRRSSRNNTTLRLITTMKVEKEKLPAYKRHEICFTSSSGIDKSNVKFLRDKITCKLSPTKTKKSTKLSSTTKKPTPSITKTTVTTKASSSDNKTSKKSKPECCSKEIKPCRCSNRSDAKTSKKSSAKSVGTFGTEKRKILMNLPKFFEEKKFSKPRTEEDNRAAFTSSPNVYRKLHDPSTKVLMSEEEKRSFARTRTPSPSGNSRSITRSKSTPSVLAPVKLSTLNSSLESLKSPTLVRKEKLSRSNPNVRKKIENSVSPVRETLKKAKKEEINGKIASKKSTNKSKSAKGTHDKSLKNDTKEMGTPRLNTDEIGQRHKMIHSDNFFQHLFLRDMDAPTLQKQRLWPYEHKLEKTRERPRDPSARTMKIYLNHTKPVSESKFRIQDTRPRSVSPKTVSFDRRTSSVESIDRVGRSISLPPKLIYFSQTSRPVSPVVERKHLEFHPSPGSRSPSRRRIDAIKQSHHTNPTKIPNDQTRDSTSHNRTKEFLHGMTYSTRRSSKFKDLNEFYSTLEKLGELERMASINESKLRKRSEGEIVDFDRWQEVHMKERTEKEMLYLNQKLKEKEKCEGFLYRPKDVSSYRWNRELDRGLRTREKSIENIKLELERIKLYDPTHMAKFRDTYKPLWRGSSVLNLANHMVTKRSKSEGRLPEEPKKYAISDKFLTEGIGSRIWSSLSMDQVNTLNKQLCEIYSPDTGKTKRQEFTVYVPAKKTSSNNLSVRRNSDISKPIVAKDEALSETDKKRISQSLSKEIMKKIGKNQNQNDKDEKACKERKNLKAIQTPKDKTNVNFTRTDIKRCSSSSSKEDKSRSSESGSTDESTNTVIFTGSNKEDVKQKVDYFEKALDIEEYIPTIHKPAESEFEDDSNNSPGRLVSSSSCQDLKELFGERTMMRLATCPLSSTRKSQYTSPPLQLRTTTMSPCKLSVSETTSCDSLYRSRSLSPFFDIPNSPPRHGEVRRLKDFFNSYCAESSYKLRRCFSDSNLYKKSVFFPALVHVDVDGLRRKYEYPVRSGRGRSRMKKGGVVSPVYMRAEDRFMPHINIISKIATLCSKKYDKAKSPSKDDLSEILSSKSGDVGKLKEKFDKSKNISLLGKMFTSSPDMKELKDIAPYLTGSWTAHRFPRTTENSIPLLTTKNSLASMDKSDKTSPQRTKSKPSILKSHQRTRSVELPSKSKTPTGASSSSQPELNDQRYRSHWMAVSSKPSVTFKEPEPPVPPPKSHHVQSRENQEGSPRKYVENQVTIHYKTPVRQEVKDYYSEDELAYRQQEAMKKMYQDEKRRKYLQELQDMHNRRHTDNFTPSQKSPIPLNRYDDFDQMVAPQHRIRPRSPEPRLVARALYNFVGMTPRELTFRKGDNIYVRRQIDKNWYEGELNAMVGLFPVNYVEIVPYENVRTSSTARKPNEGQARAKYNFLAKTHLELSLAKGEMVILTKRVDNNWYEGKIGGRKGIFPASYVDVLIDPQEHLKENPKPIAAPAAHSLLLNGSSARDSMGSHTYTPNLPNQESSYYAKPAQANYCTSFGGKSSEPRNPLNQALHVDTPADPLPYRALYKYLPQNSDELELMEGDTVYVLEKCDDGWFVGSNERTGAFGTFPGNYVEKV